MERRAVSDAFAQGFEPILLRLSDLEAVLIERDLSIVAFDGKDFREDRLQAEVLPFGRSNVRLKKLPVGIDLDFDQVRWRDDFFDFTEIDTFCCSRWHFDLWLLAGGAPDGYFLL